MKPLINVKEPNLLEKIFDYDQVPKISFCDKIYEQIDSELVVFDPANIFDRDIHITDTTFRDGQQAKPPYSVEQIVKLYDLISKLGGPKGIIRQSEFFLYSSKDRKAVEQCRELGHRFPEITGWIRANTGEFKLVKDMGLKESGVLTPVSDYHIFFKLKKDRQGAIDEYLRIVELFIENGIRPRCHLEDVTRADIDGFVIPYVQQLSKATENVPDELKVKIRLCDTLGFGIGYPGVELPRSIPKLIYKIINECNITSDRLEWHGHNDFHKVHINGGTAWIYGCNALNTTLVGFGERTGNPPLEGAIIEYIGLKGDPNGIDTRYITEIADYISKDVGIDIPSNYPLVGNNFNKTRAGIHADGLSKDERVYNIFNTKKLLNKTPQICITDKSGADGVAFWVNQFLGLSGEGRLSKAKIAKIAKWVNEQYEVHGRNTGISDDELVGQVKTHLPQFYEKRR
ncbi:MAG: 2-isopropylmalate synthase [Candidatus Anammoxibacter sp.]